LSLLQAARAFAGIGFDRPRHLLFIVPDIDRRRVIVCLCECKTRSQTHKCVDEWMYQGKKLPHHRRIIYPASMKRDAVVAELLEIEGLLQDDTFYSNSVA
jgi:hypothetical protein